MSAKSRKIHSFVPSLCYFFLLLVVILFAGPMQKILPKPVVLYACWGVCWAICCLVYFCAVTTNVRRGLALALCVAGEVSLYYSFSPWWLCVMIVIGFVIQFLGDRGEAQLGRFCIAKQEGKIELAMLFGADIDGGRPDLPEITGSGWPAGKTALMEVVEAGDISAVRRMLGYGANVNAQDSKGRTPLMYVPMPPGDDKGPTVDKALLLLDNGADIMAHDDSGCTALHHAAMSGSLSLMRVFLKKGVPVDVCFNDKGGLTPLMGAAAGGCMEAMKMLLDNGADVNAKCSRGKTPLIWAVDAKSAGAVKMLLERGADVHAEDEAGRTALDYARNLAADEASCASKGMSELVKVLEETGV